jgi:hypothetical protein
VILWRCDLESIILGGGAKMVFGFAQKRNMLQMCRINVNKNRSIFAKRSEECINVENSLKFQKNPLKKPQ